MSENSVFSNKIYLTLKALYAGEAIDRAWVEKNLDVKARSSYRYIERLNDILERRPDGLYQLKASQRGKINHQDVRNLVDKTGVAGLHPKTADYFLDHVRQQEDANVNASDIVVQGHHYEAQDPYDPTFEQLTEAIKNQRECSCRYKDKSRQLEPYRLYNKNGIWYLQATEAQKLKTFSLSQISHLQVVKKTFARQASVQAELDTNNDIWITGEKIKVRLQVSAAMAHYVKRRPLFPEQVLDAQPQADGSLQFSSQMGHIDQILPLIQYWLPHIQILEPATLQAELLKRLTTYIANQEKRV